MVLIEEVGDGGRRKQAICQTALQTPPPNPTSITLLAKLYAEPDDPDKSENLREEPCKSQTQINNI